MKLKPCPFCGGKAKYETVEASEGSIDPNAGGEFILCTKCNASSSIMFPLMDSVKELVIEKWNNRIESQTIKKAI